MPTNDEQWSDAPRTIIDVRRDFVLKDAIREAKKKKFDPSKLLRVCLCIYVVLFMLCTQIQFHRLRLLVKLVSTLEDHRGSFGDFLLMLWLNHTVCLLKMVLVSSRGMYQPCRYNLS